MPSDFYIGLMSGTSADAIDAVLVDFSQGVNLVGYSSEPLPPSLRHEIHLLATPGNNEIDRAYALDQKLGDLFASSVISLLNKTGISRTEVVAIGCHGQTVRHRPTTAGSRGFSLQIGDPNIIAHTTKITTVADFRRRDIAAGGQGAPLVPAFHHAIFHSSGRDRLIVNIGGIANITWLPGNGAVLGFDTGPGNALMDAWIGEHKGMAYDTDGAWAASGSPDQELLNKLLSNSFFALDPPKSTGRELFNLHWLTQTLAQLNRTLSPADVQATLLELTALTLSKSIGSLVAGENAEVFVCGGGAYNKQLMAVLARLLPHCQVSDTSDLGIHPQWVEALAFAWLARQTISHKSGNLRSATGADSEVILGGVYFA